MNQAMNYTLKQIERLLPVYLGRESQVVNAIDNDQLRRLQQCIL
jgi:hypothetical protein